MVYSLAHDFSSNLDKGTHHPSNSNLGCPCPVQHRYPVLKQRTAIHLNIVALKYECIFLGRGECNVYAVRRHTS
jgi:hypothetical protein